MPYRLFQYPLPTSGELEDLNAWLASQRVASVTHHLVDTRGAPMLIFLVETLEAAPPRAGRSEPRVDYREILSDEQFARMLAHLSAGA